MGLGHVGALPGALTPHNPEELLDFVGGMVDSRVDHRLRPNQMPLSDNWTIDREAGNLVKRPGLSSAVSLGGEAAAVRQGLNGNYLILTGAIADLTGAILHSGLTSSRDPSLSSLGVRDCLVNGTDALFTTDGSTWTDMRIGQANPLPAGVKYLAAESNYMFALGHNASEVQWSSINNALDWPGRGSIEISEYVWNPTGMTSWDGAVWVFFDRSFYGLRGATSRSVQIAFENKTVGASSNRSLVPTPYGLYFWSNDYGLCRTTGGGRVGSEDLIGWRWVPKLLGARNKAADDRVHGLWNPAQERVEYWWCGPGSSTPNKLLYSYPRWDDACFPGSGTAAERSGSGIVFASNAQTAYAGSAPTGFLLGTDVLDAGTLGSSTLHQLSGDDDAGEPIEAVMQTYRSALGGSQVAKRSAEITLEVLSAGAGNVRVDAFYDSSIVADESWDMELGGLEGFLLGTDSLDTGSLGSDLKLEELRFQSRQNWRRIKLQLTDSTPARNKLNGFVHEGGVWNA